MINRQVEKKITSTWSKTQQNDFYELIRHKREMIRILIRRVRKLSL
jgi:hypothetical protein